MSVLSKDGWNIDYVEVGTGSPVVLIHSSVSGNQEYCRAIIEVCRFASDEKSRCRTDISAQTICSAKGIWENR